MSNVYHALGKLLRTEGRGTEEREKKRRSREIERRARIGEKEEEEEEEKEQRGKRGRAPMVFLRRSDTSCGLG